MYSGWNQTVTLRHLQEIMCKADHKVNDVFKQLLTDNYSQPCIKRSIWGMAN